MEQNNKPGNGSVQNNQNNQGKQKEIWIGVIILVIIALIAFLIGHKSTPTSSVVTEGTSTDTMSGMDMNATATTPAVTSSTAVNFDYENMTYYINGDAFPMKNGATVSGTTASPKLSGNLLEGPAFADINSDGQKDAAVIVRVATAGLPNTLYYLDVLLGNGTSATSTNPVFLGDRIHVQSISILSNQVTVAILDRASGQSFAVFPSVSKTLIFRVVGNTLSPVN